MKLHHALEWEKVGEELKRQLLNIDYNPDLFKMHKNIGVMITELSKLEVEARRTHNVTAVNEKLTQINKAIIELEKWIVMALLLK